MENIFISIENRLNELISQYLTGYPNKIERKEYLKRREELKKNFRKNL